MSATPHSIKNLDDDYINTNIVTSIPMVVDNNATVVGRVAMSVDWNVKHMSRNKTLMG